jgi:amino-acid N-acetyltransferase
MTTPLEVSVRPVKHGDQDAIQQLIEPFVDLQKLLPRTLAELQELLATGFVAEHSGQIIGFAALEVYSAKLAEIRSLAVDRRYQGSGIGQRLVEACLQLARQRQILEVMAISSSESFFQSCGFDFTLPGEKKAFFFRTQ